MKRLKFYRILSYILLPVGAFLGLATLLSLVMALGNFALLFSVFIAAATVIYIFSSFAFLRRVVIGQNDAKRSLKDLVKVNAYAAMLFAVIGVVESIGILFSKEVLQAAVDAMVVTQPAQLKVDKALLLQTMKTAMYIILVIGIILQVHINLTFRYLRENEHHFAK